MSDTLPAELGGFDLTDQSEFAKGFPHDVFARLRAEAPVFWHPAGKTADGEGFWVVTRHADLVEAGANDEVFSAQGGGGRAGGGTHIDDVQTGVHAGVLINMQDDPRHGHMRDLVDPVVARDALQSSVPELTEIVGGLVDDAIEKGVCDFQPDVTAPFAIRTIARMLGAPREDWDLLVGYGTAIAGFDNRETGKVDDGSVKTQYAIYEYSKKIIALKREQGPSNDLMSAMVHSDITDIAPQSGQPGLSEYEREAFFCLLLLAGSEPARNAMAAGVHALSQNPDQWHALREDRSLIPTAIEEIARWSSPTPYNRRTATRDTVFRGHEISAGQKITFWWASGNRDADVFENADRFDVSRAHNPHLAFGRGIHSCLGEQLARIEMRLLLEALLDRVTEIKPAGDVRWSPSNKHTVALHLPLELVRA